MLPKELNDWLQAIGLFGVLGGLIFVGFQMKQSQEIAISSQYSDRASDTQAYWHFVGEHPFLLAQLGRAHRDHLRTLSGYRDDWTDEELGLVYVMGRAYLTNWDNNYYQYESGFMTDEGWSTWSNRIRAACTTDESLTRQILSNHQGVFLSGLIELCSSPGID